MKKKFKKILFLNTKNIFQTEKVLFKRLISSKDKGLRNGCIPSIGSVPKTNLLERPA